MNFFWKLLDAAIYYFSSPRCPLCDEIVDKRHEVCSACEKRILRVDFCEYVPENIEKVLRVTKYRGGSQKLLHKLKFENNRDVLPAFKKILDEISRREEILELLDGINFAVPVPIHQKRFEERGFNQTDEIFREWLLKNNIPEKHLLIRVKNTPKLYDLGKFERQEILRDVFAANRQIDLRGQKILLFDDIYTTGTTVSECAKVLKSLGAEKIRVIAFASDFGEEFAKKIPNASGKIFYRT